MQLEDGQRVFPVDNDYTFFGYFEACYSLSEFAAGQGTRLRNCHHLPQACGARCAAYWLSYSTRSPRSVIFFLSLSTIHQTLFSGPRPAPEWRTRCPLCMRVLCSSTAPTWRSVSHQWRLMFFPSSSRPLNCLLLLPLLPSHHQASPSLPITLPPYTASTSSVPPSIPPHYTLLLLLLLMLCKNTDLAASCGGAEAGDIYGGSLLEYWLATEPVEASKHIVIYSVKASVATAVRPAQLMSIGAITADQKGGAHAAHVPASHSIAAFSYACTTQIIGVV